MKPAGVLRQVRNIINVTNTSEEKLGEQKKSQNAEATKFKFKSFFRDFLLSRAFFILHASDSKATNERLEVTLCL